MIYVVKTKKANSSKLKCEVINDDCVVYAGPILDTFQIKNLNEFGNTVLSYSVYKQLGDELLAEEIKRLTGLHCLITVHTHMAQSDFHHGEEQDAPSVIIERIGKVNESNTN